MIAILDYGLGNMKAFANIFTQRNIPFRIAANASDINEADKLILPGVGAFDSAMLMLKNSALYDPLNEAVLTHKKPVLGVCVGMQILAETSEEGHEQGLGWISGKVHKIQFQKQQRPILPHMGWNSVTDINDHPLFDGVDPKTGFYFLHSYEFHCSHSADIIGRADYAAQFTCAVQKDNIYGVQFHPEKSHDNGTTLLANFSAL